MHRKLFPFWGSHNILPSPRANPKPLIVVSHLKAILFFFFIFPLKLNSVLISPARDITSLYGMSAGHPFLEMVPTLFTFPSYEDLVCLFASISLQSHFSNIFFSLGPYQVSQMFDLSFFWYCYEHRVGLQLLSAMV